jgi:hypothetical protein
VDSLERVSTIQVLFDTWGRLAQAMALFKEVETLCLELGKRSSLAKCYLTGAFLRVNSMIARRSGKNWLPPLIYSAN